MSWSESRCYDDKDVINDLIGSSITFRVAVGKNKGKKVYTLQTIPAQLEEMERNKVLAKECGFSLLAGVSAKSLWQIREDRTIMSLHHKTCCLIKTIAFI